MMHLNSNGGQIILADDGYFYILNKRGFYICSFNTEPVFVYFNSQPTNNNKVTWWGAGWTEKHLIVADVSHSFYAIPRHTNEFDTMAYCRHLHLPVQGGIGAAPPEKVPFVPALYYTSNRRAGTRDEAKMCFDKCFRYRQLVKDERYKREDAWMGHTASVFESCKEMINKDRDKIVINGTKYMPLARELANDICFSMDGLMLYVLHQAGKVTIIDVD